MSSRWWSSTSSRVCSVLANIVDIDIDIDAVAIGLRVEVTFEDRDGHAGPPFRPSGHAAPA